MRYWCAMVLILSVLRVARWRCAQQRPLASYHFTPACHTNILISDGATMGEKLGGSVLSNSFLGGRKASFPSLCLSPPPLLGKTHASGQELWYHQEGVPGDWGVRAGLPSDVPQWLGCLGLCSHLFSCLHSLLSSMHRVNLTSQPFSISLW